MLEEKANAIKETLKDMKKKVTDAAETAQITAMVKKDEYDDVIAEKKGDLAAAVENARLVSERMGGKVNSLLLQSQMNISSVKEQMNEKIETANKERRKAHIQDLIDYSEACESLAAQLIAEADVAVIQALKEKDEYMEEFGEEI